MGIELARAFITIRADQSKLAGDFQRTKARATKMASGIATSVRNIMPSLGVLAGAGAFVQLLRSGEDFNRKMRSSLAIMGEVSTALRVDMKEAALVAARVTKFSAAEVAEAYFFLASAGLTAEQSIAALPQVAAFAQAGMFNLARATELATDAQSALGLTVKDPVQNLKNLTHVTDVLVKANTLANASVEQFASAMTNKAAAAARIVGIDIEELTAILAAFADQGVKSARAGNAINIILRDMQSKAIENKEAFDQFGVSVFDNTGKLRKIADVIGDLEKALGPMTDEQKKATLAQLGFSDRSVIFLQTLLGTSEKIRNYEKELQKAGGTTKDVANKQLTPLQKGMARIGAVFASVSSDIINVIGPMVEAIGKGVERIEKFFRFSSLGRGIRTAMKNMVGFFAEGFGRVIVLAASVVVSILAIKVALGVLSVALSTAFVVATGPIGAVIGLLTALGIAIVIAAGTGDTFAEKMEDVFSNKLPAIIDGALFVFRNFADFVELAMIDLTQDVLEIFPNMEKPMQQVGAFFVGVWKGVGAFFRTILDNMIGGLKELKNVAIAIAEGMAAAFEALKSGDFSGIGVAFANAFVETLAKQKDVVAPNAFGELGKGFAKGREDALEGFKLSGGGLSASLEARRKKLEDDIGRRELKRQQDLEKATKKAVEEVKIPEIKVPKIPKPKIPEPREPAIEGRFGLVDFGKQIQDALLKGDKDKVQKAQLDAIEKGNEIADEQVAATKAIKVGVFA